MGMEREPFPLRSLKPGELRGLAEEPDAAGERQRQDISEASPQTDQ